MTKLSVSSFNPTSRHESFPVFSYLPTAEDERTCGRWVRTCVCWGPGQSAAPEANAADRGPTSATDPPPRGWEAAGGGRNLSAGNDGLPRRQPPLLQAVYSQTPPASPVTGASGAQVDPGPDMSHCRHRVRPGAHACLTPRCRPHCRSRSKVREASDWTTDTQRDRERGEAATVSLGPGAGWGPPALLAKCPLPKAACLRGQGG